MKNLLIFLFLISFHTIQAQRTGPENSKTEKGKTTDKNSESEDGESKATNLFTGGSVSFGLSSYGFNAGLHPHFGYTLTNWLDVAAVVNFEYTS